MKASRLPQARYVHFTMCSGCGKRSYATRNDARLARTQKHGVTSLRQLRPYRCTVTNEWHLGTLSKSVIDGRSTRDDYYDLPRQYRPQDDLNDLPQEAPMTDTNTMSADDINAVITKLLADGQHPADVATAVMDGLLADLNTYRFIEQLPISPPLARRILELNADNQRNHRQSLSDRYARDMGTGRWTEKNGQPINIATNGRVINGQHRLQGIIKSGKTVRFDVNMGISPDAIVVIDAGASRSAVDVIRTSGGTDLSGIASIVRWIIMWEMGTPTGRGGRFAPTPLELKQRYEADSDLFNTAAARGGDAYARGLTTKAVGGTAYFLFAKKNKAIADDLFDQIVSGLNLQGDDRGAAWQLRSRLFARASAKLARHEQLALFIRAWNLYNTIKNGERVPVGSLPISADGPLTNDNFPRVKQPALPTL